MDVNVSLPKSRIKRTKTTTSSDLSEPSHVVTVVHVSSRNPLYHNTCVGWWHQAPADRRPALCVWSRKHVCVHRRGVIEHWGVRGTYKSGSSVQEVMSGQSLHLGSLTWLVPLYWSKWGLSCLASPYACLQSSKDLFASESTSDFTWIGYSMYNLLATGTDTHFAVNNIQLVLGCRDLCSVSQAREENNILLPSFLVNLLEQTQYSLSVQCSVKIGLETKLIWVQCSIVQQH